MFRMLSLSLLVVVVAWCPARGDLIVNGDFSSGNTGFVNNYQYAVISTAEGAYTVGTNPKLFNSFAPSFGDHTTGSGLMLIADGSPTPNQTVWQQTVAVNPGSVYTFSGWDAAWGNVNGVDPSPASLVFSINGSQIGGPNAVTATDGEWSQIQATWFSGSSTSATLRIVDTNTVAFGNDFTLDDLSFAAVPEPSSMALCGFAAWTLGFSVWRRGKAKAVASGTPTL